MKRSLTDGLWGMGSPLILDFGLEEKAGRRGGEWAAWGEQRDWWAVPSLLSCVFPAGLQAGVFYDGSIRVVPRGCGITCAIRRRPR